MLCVSSQKQSFKQISRELHWKTEWSKIQSHSWKKEKKSVIYTTTPQKTKYTRKEYFYKNISFFLVQSSMAFTYYIER